MLLIAFTSTAPRERVREREREKKGVRGRINVLSIILFACASSCDNTPNSRNIKRVRERVRERGYESVEMINTYLH